MTRAAAHLACVALVALDAAVRAWRLRLLLRAAGARAGLGACAATNGAADLAAALSPMRVAGLPVHAAALARVGVPLPRGVAALGVEALVTYPVVALLGAALAAAYGATWTAAALPALARALRARGGLLLLVLAAAAAALWAARPLARRLARRLGPAGGAPGGGVRAALAHARAVPARALVATAALTALQVAARVAVLPVLTRALPVPPDVGVAALGAFALLYGQLAVPTPSGAGAVELAGAAGAAGALGEDAAWVLGWWRAYTAAGSVVLTLPWLWQLRRRRRTAAAA